MALWRLYYHFVWSTKGRRNLITPEMEPALYRYIIGKATAFSAIVHAIDGTTNHTHMVASVPPSLALSEFMKEIKGSSSHHINHGTVKYPLTFAWQGGYGVFSLSSKQLDDAIAYVLNQKEHHAQGTLIPALEHEERDDDQPQIWRDGAGIRRFPIPDLQQEMVGERAGLPGSLNMNQGRLSKAAQGATIDHRQTDRSDRRSLVERLSHAR